MTGLIASLIRRFRRPEPTPGPKPTADLTTAELAAMDIDEVWDRWRAFRDDDEAEAFRRRWAAAVGRDHRPRRLP